MHTQCWAVDFIYHSCFVLIFDQIQQVILSTTKCAFRASLHEIIALLWVFNQQFIPCRIRSLGHRYKNSMQLHRASAFFNFKANVANGTNVSTLFSVLSGLSHLALHIFVMMQLRAAKAGASSII